VQKRLDAFQNRRNEAAGKDHMFFEKREHVIKEASIWIQKAESKIKK
jgi:hypothetical protein